MKKTVTLLKDHTDRGIQHKAGAKIQVNEPTNKWLEDQGIVAKATKKAQLAETDDNKGNV